MRVAVMVARSYAKICNSRSVKDHHMATHATEGDEGFVTEITKQSVDFSRWYIDVVRKAELADYSPVKGCMVIRPVRLCDLGVHPARARRAHQGDRATSTRTFRCSSRESLLTKEAEHVEGFAPQVAWVTKGGTEDLEERLVVRPTSETIFGVMYQKWIQSWRDLPVLINQWANVVRWEKVTRPFLRTTEFLWQEGHTAHETADEAQEETMKILALYKDVCENVLAVPVIDGQEERERKVCRRVAHLLDRSADGRRPRSAGGHLAQPRSELRQGLQHPVPGPGQDVAARVDDLVGRDHASGRRGDHDARRRQRAHPAAEGRALAGRDRADSSRQLERNRAAQVHRDSRSADGGRDSGEAGRRRQPDAGMEVRRVRDARRAAASGDWSEGHREVGRVRGAARHAREVVAADGGPGRRRFTACSTRSSSRCSTGRRKFRDEHTSTADSYDAFKEIMEGRPGFVIAPWCESAAARRRSRPRRRRRFAISRTATTRHRESRASGATSRRRCRRGLRKRINPGVPSCRTARRPRRRGGRGRSSGPRPGPG